MLVADICRDCDNPRPIWNGIPARDWLLPLLQLLVCTTFDRSFADYVEGEEAGRSERMGA